MKNLCSGTYRGGFQFLLTLDLWDISFHAVVVFGLGKSIIFKSTLERCVQYPLINYLDLEIVALLQRTWSEKI